MLQKVPWLTAGLHDGGDRAMMAQTLYKGKFGDQRPTQEQLTLLRRMAIREDVIRNLSREEAYLLIKTILQRYYEARFERQRKPFEVYIKW